MRAFLGRQWFLLLLGGGLGASLLWPGAMEPATRYWNPSLTVALSLFLVAWTMPTHFLLAEVRRPFASLWAVVLSYGLVPLTAWLIGHLAPSDDIGVGLVLVSSVPCTLSSAVLWTRLAGGNEATALLTVVGTTFSSWFLTTAWLYALTGTQTQLDVGKMMVDLIATLILPFVLGQALRWHPQTMTIADQRRSLFGVLSQLLIVGIVIKAGVAVGEKLHETEAWSVPFLFLISIVLAVGLHLFAVASGLISGGWLGFERGRRIAIGFAASQKTLPVSLMLYDQFFKDAYPYAVLPLLFYHVGQLLLDTLIAKRIGRSGGIVDSIC
jgi:sodium/bile acid cotransporter 7